MDALTAEERHQLYKILKLRARAGQDGSVKVSGVFGDSFSICKSELAPPCRFRSQELPTLCFRALLDKDVPEVELTLI